MWTGGDVSARYERSRVLAQQRVDEDAAKTSVTNSDGGFSSNQDLAPYQNELQNAKDLQSIPAEYQQPSVSGGKAQLQVMASRQQVLDDKKGGGLDVLKEEAREEKEVRAKLKRSTRRRANNSISGTDSFRGLRDRVTGSMHAGGGIIGMESSR